MLRLFLLLIALSPSLILRAADPASLVFESGRYPDSQAAQSAWRPSSIGTLPVSVTNLEGKAALRMPCQFIGKDIERASWDKAVQLDLSTARGVRLQFWCANPAPVSHFSLYFKSGAGWYSGTFYPGNASQWNDIAIDKTVTQAEGTPTGWGKIDAIRVSAWRGNTNNTEFYIGAISRVGELGVDASVAILRADSVSAGDRTAFEQAAEGIGARLSGLGIGCAVLSDLDASAERLKAAKLVVLPYNPSVPEPVAQELKNYLQAGGRIMAFYHVPPTLRPMLGVTDGGHVKAANPGAYSKIRFVPGALEGAPDEVEQQSWNINNYKAVEGRARVLAEWVDARGTSSGQAALIASSNGVVMTHILLPGDPARKDRLMLALTGYLIPELWPQAAQEAIRRAGELSKYRTFDETVDSIQALSRSAKVVKAVQNAKRLRAEATSLAAAGNYGQAIDRARDAHRHLEEAYCLAQKGERGEFRAYWCHSAFGVRGIEWDEAIERLADNGFTAILPNMLWGGVAFYPSRVLPTASAVSTQGDQIEACLKAAKKHGIEVHVWKVNWNLGSAAPKEFLERMRAAGRLQRSFQGKEEPWLCPSHPENQKLEVDSMVEVVRNYPVNGIHFDYIRYPDSSHCFCDGCRERFQKLHPSLKDWPKDVLSGGNLRQEWLEWRRANITAVVRETSKQARQVRKGIKLSAAVFRNWPNDRDSVGQDWKFWCDQGYLDFVCPMDYTDNNRVFENMVRQQREWAGKVPCYPGIGVSASASSFGVDKVIDQILITRNHQTKGFVIFNYGVPESGTLTPLLGKGITR
jgi:uncharacterized lipoprotein YddW (UPF0748 family)